MKKRWLTKEEKRLLKPHAKHYQEMASHIREATAEELQKLLSTCLSCTQINCGWDDYAAAQYLTVEIRREIGWRNRRDSESVELLEPAAQVDARWADDGGAIM
jgi:hypothetical protein